MQTHIYVHAYLHISIHMYRLHCTHTHSWHLHPQRHPLQSHIHDHMYLRLACTHAPPFPPSPLTTVTSSRDSGDLFLLLFAQGVLLVPDNPAAF